MFGRFYTRSVSHFAIFILIYSYAALYLRYACARNPSSRFFQPDLAHRLIYSQHRLEEAENATASAEAGAVSKWDESKKPSLCVSINSVQRKDISYLKTAVGSLSAGLHEQERGNIYVTVLLAHPDQSQHSEYEKPWLKNMVDNLPAYEERHLDNGDALPKGMKAKLDYFQSLEACVKTGAEYIMGMEDDVIARDGWLHRTLAAVQEAHRRTVKLGRENFLYLRLFYYENLLGWNKEEWVPYLVYSALVTSPWYAFLFVFRHRPPLPTLVLLAIVPPLSVGLFFYAGRNCMMPLPHDIFLMPKYACCAQALVFPRATLVNELLPHYWQNWNNNGMPTDSYIEDWADNNDALRWAINPALMQHIGGVSSLGNIRDKYGQLTPNKIFNVHFEDSDKSALEKEHEAYVQHRFGD